jgi:hypothetical protein
MEIPVFEKKHVFLKIPPDLHNEFNNIKIANMGYRLLKD